MGNTSSENHVLKIYLPPLRLVVALRAGGALAHVALPVVAWFTRNWERQKINISATWCSEILNVSSGKRVWKPMYKKSTGTSYHGSRIKFQPRKSRKDSFFGFPRDLFYPFHFLGQIPLIHPPAPSSTHRMCISKEPTSAPPPPPISWRMTVRDFPLPPSPTNFPFLQQLWRCH